MSFLLTPAGDAYSMARIGGAKAVDTGLLILGNGPDELLEYYEAPGPVAALWRDELVALLGGYRPHRPVRQLDWLALAAKADVAWAKENGWSGPAQTAAPGPAAAEAGVSATAPRPFRPSSAAAE
jgi:hypothetical protein